MAMESTLPEPEKLIVIANGKVFRKTSQSGNYLIGIIDYAETKLRAVRKKLFQKVPDEDATLAGIRKQIWSCLQSLKDRKTIYLKQKEAVGVQIENCHGRLCKLPSEIDFEPGMYPDLDKVRQSITTELISLKAELRSLDSFYWKDIAYQKEKVMELLKEYEEEAYILNDDTSSISVHELFSFLDAVSDKQTIIEDYVETVDEGEERIP